MAVYNFVTNPYFDYALLIIISLNCVAMAMEGPMWAPGSPMFEALYWCDVGFTILFGIEAAIKMFAFTFVAYIKDITNQVRCVIGDHHHIRKQNAAAGTVESRSSPRDGACCSPLHCQHPRRLHTLLATG